MNEASLQFHIQQNDYFGTLATVLDLVSQNLDRHGYNPHAGTLSRLRDDLLYLQRTHRIEKSRTPGFPKRKDMRTDHPHLSWCPLGVHDGPERERQAAIK